MTKPPTAEQPTTPFTFSRQLCEERFALVVDNLNQFTGKVGRNPFIWIREHVQPLVKRLQGWTEQIKDETTGKLIKEINHPPEQTKELHDAIFALSLNVDPVYVKYPEEGEVVQAPKIVMTPQGMMSYDEALAKNATIIGRPHVVK